MKSPSFSATYGYSLFQGNLTVEIFPPADLIVESLNLDKETAIAGEDITAEIIFKNQGGSSGERTFPLYLNNSKISNVSSGELNAGATSIKSFTFVVPTTGEYQVCI